MENEIIINGVTYVKKEDNQKKQSKRGNVLWYICAGGAIEDTEQDTYADDFKPFCYSTEAEAIKARDKQLALYHIKTYAEEKRGEFAHDWNNYNQRKYYIAYVHKEKKYTWEYNYFTQNLISFYLEKEEHCNEIIEKFKDDLDILFDRKG